MAVVIGGPDVAQQMTSLPFDHILFLHQPHIACNIGHSQRGYSMSSLEHAIATACEIGHSGTFCAGVFNQSPQTVKLPVIYNACIVLIGFDLAKTLVHLPGER